MTPLTALALAELPSLPIEGRRELPDMAAVYFVLAGDTVLYIGQSGCLRQRWLAHHRLAQLGEYGACRIAWMDVSDAGLLDELEQACIAHFNPILNDSPALNQDVMRVTILYPPDVVERVQALAHRQGDAFTALLRQWTIQRLEDEEQRQPCGQDVQE